MIVMMMIPLKVVVVTIVKDMVTLVMVIELRDGRCGDGDGGNGDFREDGDHRHGDLCY